MFVVFDGIDGCGKSLIAGRLADLMRREGRAVLEVRDPGSTALAEKIRELILYDTDVRLDPDAEFYLYNAARAQLLSEIICPALEEQKVVICDRFDSSTFAYQVHAGQFSPEIFDAIQKKMAQIASPDLYVVLDVPVEVARKRLSGVGDRIEARDNDYQVKVREGFGLFVKRNPEKAVMLDAQADVETVLTNATHTLKKRFGEHVL